MVPKFFREVEGFPNYLVSEFGKVWSKKSSRFLTDFPNNERGYRAVRLSKDGEAVTTYLHRIVAKAYVPNPNSKPQVNHIDGNVENNIASNLEWTTLQENMKHMRATVKSWGKLKLTEEERIDIAFSSASDKDLADTYGITVQYVGQLRRKYNGR